MTKLKDKPFALIGVNSWTDDPAKLREVMTREKLNWRSFTGEERINRQWNLPATPTMYVLDHTGKIRHKWVGKVGDQVVDAALDRLIANAESSIQPVGQ